MLKPDDWASYAEACHQAGALALEAQAVIWMRLWGMAGFWNVSPGENSRMISEKLSAGLQAQQAALLAVAQGRSPAEIATSALRPMRRKASANRSRLLKRGPKIG